MLADPGTNLETSPLCGIPPQDTTARMDEPESRLFKMVAQNFHEFRRVPGTAVTGVATLTVRERTS